MRAVAEMHHYGAITFLTHNIYKTLMGEGAVKSYCLAADGTLKCREMCFVLNMLFLEK